MSEPIIAIVGRPNVGKSTLFNILTRTRAAIVADEAGVTRDRQYGQSKLLVTPCKIIDTGGLTKPDGKLETLMVGQVEAAIEEASVILFIVDARCGLHPEDIKIAKQLRRLEKKVLLVVNKIDGLASETVLCDFYQLGFDVIGIAASHRRGIKDLVRDVNAFLPEQNDDDMFEEQIQSTTVSVIGRPNVGKSTLVNRVLGEERVVVLDEPGTTRSAIDVTFERHGEHYTFIDTAGVRKRGRVHETIEKFSVIKTLESIERAQVVVLLIDGQVGISDQDCTLIQEAVHQGRGVIIAINKWDGLDQDKRDEIKAELKYRFNFAPFVKIHTISALHGTGVGHLFKDIQSIVKQAKKPLETKDLTKLLMQAQEEHSPPLVKGRRIKLRYAHCGGHIPPIIVIHGNQTDEVPGTYKRYLQNFFREELNLTGTPIKLIFKSNENPFEGRRNTLTPRQMHKRKRLMKHIKKSEKRKKKA
jgi:GTP-binding protein